MKRLRIAKTYDWDKQTKLLTILSVKTGGDFDPIYYYMKTAKGYFKLERFGRVKGQHHGTLTEETISLEELDRLKNEGQVGLILDGLRVGDKVKEPVQLEGLFEGSEILRDPPPPFNEDLPKKISVKGPKGWGPSDSGRPLKGEHFDGIIERGWLTWVK